MKNNEIIKQSFLRSVGVFIYVALVACLMFNGEKIFGGKENILIPIFLLLLFLISATVTGFLVLEKPIVLYISGEKKKSIIFLFSVISWLVLFATLILTYFTLT